MTEQSVTLVLAGRGSLTIPGGGRFRTVQGGQPFAVDAALATVLLASDPNLSVAEVDAPAPPPAPTPAVAPTAGSERPLTSLKVAELVAIATDLGLEVPRKPAKGPLIDAITTERERLAAAASARAETEGDEDGDEVAPETEPTGPEPETPSTGTVTLADLPSGGMVGGDQQP